MTVIRQQDLIDSVADALQFISYYHPLDYARPQTREEARRLMRTLIAQRLPGQVLHTRAVLKELQDL